MKEEDELMKILISILKFTILLLIVTIILCAIVNYKSKVDYENYINSAEYKQLIEKQEKCDHNYVTTSRGAGRSLHIYTICTKCNKEI